MSQPIGGNIMAALSTSLADFRAGVEGDSGRRIAAIGRAPGFIIDLCRKILGALADAFVWLGGVLDDAVDFLRIGDAFIALVEVAGDALVGVTEVVAFGDAPAVLGLPAAPFAAVESAMASARHALTVGKDLLGFVPSPDDIENVRAELRKLLGRRVDPQLQHDGALGHLLQVIAPPALSA